MAHGVKNLDMDQTTNKLRVNRIMPRASLSGGTKSNGLITEEMVRLGLEVNIVKKNWIKC